MVMSLALVVGVLLIALVIGAFVALLGPRKR
jgi:hypothetical protein